DGDDHPEIWFRGWTRASGKELTALKESFVFDEINGFSGCAGAPVCGFKHPASFSKAMSLRIAPASLSSFGAPPRTADVPVGSFSSGLRGTEVPIGDFHRPADCLRSRRL